jgi:hypothetical protein
MHLYAMPRYPQTIYVVMVLVIMFALVTLDSCTFDCHPIAYSWDTTIPGRVCFNRDALYLANGSINDATDLLILILPLFILKDLTMPRMKNIFLIGTVSL